MDTLTWWLQPELRNKMEKQTQHWPQAEGFLEELRKQGASEEYIERERQRMTQTAEEGGDDLELLT
jgi:tRNA U34 5-methylaminomethyl-2-thiouridine-forming methyltransferase MnmC